MPIHPPLPPRPSAFLDDQFPVKYRQIVPTILKTAYAAARRVRDQEPMFQTESAKQNFGRIVSYSVDCGFQQAVEQGTLPFDCSWESFGQPTGKYLALRPSHSIVTISLTRFPDRQPRGVVFRDRAKRLNSQLDFFSDQDVAGVPHILLLHGYWDPAYAHLAIPRADCDKDFSYRTKNLFNLPHVISDQGPPPEGPDDDIDAVLQLKEEIDRWRRDNGEQ